MAMLSGKWEEILTPEFKKPYYRTLYEQVKAEYHQHAVFPPSADIFNAFHLTPFENIKVVIIGQDPYHEVGQAEGLAFSVKDGTPFPPSLENIFKELNHDIGCPIPTSGSLRGWASQGVLLLNTVLTVREHQAFSHRDLGWLQFTDAAIQAIDALDQPIVFILWGKPAQEKEKFIHNPNRLVIKSPHPSPLSSYRGFFGSRPFSKANAYLEAHGITPIDWSQNK